MKIADLKEEALSYKKQLDNATNELSGFKNVGINPMDDINEAISGAKKSFTEAADEAQKDTITTPVEPKKEKITFEKKKKKKKSAESKGGDA